MLLNTFIKDHDLLNLILYRIDDRGVIKVADFGLSKSTYEKLYFRQDKSEHVKLPIKWLAIESIEYGLFSEKSDVVSNFKIVLYIHFKLVICTLKH